MSTGQKQNRSEHAFTLLEVMIACGILFVCLFAILALVSNSLRNARRLRQIDIDAGVVAAQMFRTNRLTEGVTSGDLDDMGFPDYHYDADAEEYATNGLWQVDITLMRRGKAEPIDRLQILVYSPESRTSRAGPGPYPSR